MKILLVEDETEIGELIKNGLEKGISLDLDLLGGYVRNVATIGRKA